MAVLTNPAPNTDADAPGSEDAGSAEAGSELEFRARHRLTIDPMAHTLLSLADARRLGAVPLGKEGGRTVIAVADPAESRLEALRALAGPTTKFVLVASDALNALLKSRMFGEDATTAEAEAKPPAKAEPAGPPPVVHPPLAFAPPAEPTPAAFAPVEVVPVHEPAVEEPLPVVPAVEPLAQAAEPAEFAPTVEAHPAEFVQPAETHTEPAWSPPPESFRDEAPPFLPPAAPDPPGRLAVEGELAELSAAVAGAAKLLLVLQERVSNFATRFDDASNALEAARQEARDHKERLAVISAKTDQDRARLRTFALGLSQAFEGLEETKSQLLGLIDED